MSRAIHNLSQTFICPKCRGRQPDCREVVISKSGLLHLFPCKDNRYIEVTCSLCGYTEFYNRALYVKCHKQETAAEQADQLTPASQKSGGNR